MTQAIEHYRKLVELEASVGVNQFLLAEAYEQRGMYPEAIEGYAKHNVTRGFLSPKEEER
jgi:tetratricopeptide (TPR) repeat protein